MSTGSINLPNVNIFNQENNSKPPEIVSKLPAEPPTPSPIASSTPPLPPNSSVNSEVEEEAKEEDV